MRMALAAMITTALASLAAAVVVGDLRVVADYRERKVLDTLRLPGEHTVIVISAGDGKACPRSLQMSVRPEQPWHYFGGAGFYHVGIRDPDIARPFIDVMTARLTSELQHSEGE